MKALVDTVLFLRNCYRAAQIEGSRARLDVFTDRLIRSTGAATLCGAMEALLRAVNVSAGQMIPATVVAMVQLTSSSEAPHLLQWLRDQARLVALLAAIDDDSVIDEALAAVALPTAATAGVAACRRPYAIKIRARCETPLSHGADTKAGNATLFRRIDVLATNGAHLVLPYYSGNALRGQIRDLLADHLLSALGLFVDHSKPAVALWFFYALYSGGALEERSDAVHALRKHLGAHGAVRSEGIRRFRDLLPSLSLLGCALGNRVLPGHSQFADLRPVCTEWGTGSTPVAELLTWEFLTRREDFEDHAQHHGMIVNTEVLRAGTELEGGVDLDVHVPALEQSALGCGLQLLAARGMLGAENRRGLGRVQIAVTDAPDPVSYETWIAKERKAILEYLQQIGALV
jgi:hypothetical protein